MNYKFQKGFEIGGGFFILLTKLYKQNKKSAVIMASACFTADFFYFLIL